jgi:hypothetical protein
MFTKTFMPLGTGVGCDLGSSRPPGDCEVDGSVEELVELSRLGGKIPGSSVVLLMQKPGVGLSAT